MQDDGSVAPKDKGGVVGRPRVEVVRAARRAVSRMRGDEDLDAVLDAIRGGLQALRVPLSYCGVNLVDTTADVPTVMVHSMTEDGQWHCLPSASAQTVLRLWLGGEVVYRRDLHRYDPYDELRHFHKVAAVVDVPFAYGTLAMSSEVPDAFTDRDLEVLEEMAGVLESGLDRLDGLKRAAVRQRLRDELWRMRDREDIDAFVGTLRQTLQGLGYRFHACAVNLIESGPEGLEVRSHSMQPQATWTTHRLLERPSLLERLWRLRRPVYRRDLDDQDEYGERDILRRAFGVRIRSVLDVPFAHGTLAINSTEPAAFSAEQVAELAALAQVLEEAFRRMDDLRALEERNRALQVEVAERRRAEERLAAALEAKVVLVREVHHRVKNNLQIICSLMNLQAHRIDDPRVLELFRSCRDRIATMALIHETLHASADLAHVECGDYLRRLAESVLTSCLDDPQRVGLRVDVSPLATNMDTAIRCGLVANELLTNSLQHAFPGGRRGAVDLTLRVDAQGWVHLTVRDDGVGIPGGLDLTHPDSLGLQLVTAVASQLRGVVECDARSGMHVELRFPVDQSARPA